VLVPCGVTAQLDDKSKSSLLSYCESLVSRLRDSGLRVRGDYRDNYSPGWKFNHWELKVSHISRFCIFHSHFKECKFSSTTFGNVIVPSSVEGHYVLGLCFCSSVFLQVNSKNPSLIMIIFCLSVDVVPCCKLTVDIHAVLCSFSKLL